MHSINSDYSVWNNYIYENKPEFFRFLDRLSTPFREIFGGRNVHVSSDTYCDGMSTCAKVASAIIFPIAIISAAFFLIKLATCPCDWEQKKVTAIRERAQKEQDETIKKITEFNNLYQDNKFDEASNIFLERGQIVYEPGVLENILSIIEDKINDHAPWEEIEELLSQLSHINVAKAIDLIKLAVQKKIEWESTEGHPLLTDPITVWKFVEGSLNGWSHFIERCYKQLYSETLQIDPDENIKPLCDALKYLYNLNQFIKQSSDTPTLINPLQGHLNNISHNYAQENAVNDCLTEIKNSLFCLTDYCERINCNQNPIKFENISSHVNKHVADLESNVTKLKDLLKNQIPSQSEGVSTRILETLHIKIIEAILPACQQMKDFLLNNMSTSFS